MEEIVSEKDAKNRKSISRKKTIEEEEEDEVAASRPKGVGGGATTGSLRGSVSVGQMSSLHSRQSMIDQPDTAVKIPGSTAMKKDVMVVQVTGFWR